MDTKILIEQFLQDEVNKKYAGKINNPTKYLQFGEIYECEKLFNKKLLEFNKEELLYMFSTFKSHGRPITAAGAFPLIRSAYKRFFNWCMISGHLQTNIFDTHKYEMSAGVICDYCLEKNNIELRLYYDYEIEYICKKINEIIPDGFYIEGLIRFFYEGIKTVPELISIKYDDVDFENNIINLENNKLKISKRLSEIIKTVHELNILEMSLSDKKREFFLKPYQDSAYKFPSDNLTKEASPSNISAKITSRFKLVEQYLGYKCDAKMFYMSQIFNYIYNYYNHDFERTIDLITMTEGQRKNTDELEILLLKINAKFTASQFKVSVKPYINGIIKHHQNLNV